MKFVTPRRAPGGSRPPMPGSWWPWGMRGNGDTGLEDGFAVKGGDRRAGESAE